MLERVIDQRRRDLGGFEVGRVLPAGSRRMVGPFIFFDHLGPTVFPAGIARSVDVRPHPHIGLATVTYLFEGEITHRDSVGSEQAIESGAVNWMTAGSGITHSERFEKLRVEGGPLHGIQSWVALPREQEEISPAFEHFDREALPVIDASGVRGQVIAGEVFGARSPVRAHSPLFYAHCTLARGAHLELPDGYEERAAYVVSGTIEAQRSEFQAGQMLVFERGPGASLTASNAAVVMLLGGEPVGPRFIEWNFVSSSQERIEQAKADWRAGRMQLPYRDAQERIPLPAEQPLGPGPAPPL